MLRYLLDTNIVSEFMQQSPPKWALAALQSHTQEVAISAITWHELNYGVQLIAATPKGRRLRGILDDMRHLAVPCLPYDDRAAQWHGVQRARLELLGKTPSYADGQMAAIACVNNLTVVTRNVKDFKPFEGLKVENWQSN